MPHTTEDNSKLDAESVGYIKGIEHTLFVISQSEGDIDFLEFRLKRHLKEFREGDRHV
jgi:hypothetical protein